MAVTGFAAFGSKSKVVDLAAFTVLTRDARLALTLSSTDVTLPISGTQGVAVTSLTALPTLQVVESGLTSPTVSATHVRQTFTLPCHRVAVILLPNGPIWIAITGSAFVSWNWSQRVSKEPLFAAVAVETSRVVNAFQTLSCQAVAVPHSVGVNVVIALAWAAQPHRAIPAQRIPKEAIITELTALACGASRAVGAHHFLGLWNKSTA